MPQKSKISPKPNTGDVNDLWLKKAFKKADPNAEMIIFENPNVRDALDRRIIEIWPAIRRHLESTGYAFTPIDGALRIEGRSGHILTRAMPWMLHGDYPVFHRGALECTRREWVIDSEFFLSMPSNVDFRLVQEIIGNSRLAGCPPELTIHKHCPNDYYQIFFHAGNGESWGPQSAERIIERIKKCIDYNIAMNDFAIDGEWNEEIVGEFLTQAYEVYEAH